MTSKSSDNSQPLLFIFEHNDNKPASAKRHAVYQHVQLRYSRWRRNENTKKMRASVKFPMRKEENQLSHPTDYFRHTHEAVARSHPEYDPDQILRATEELENQFDFEGKRSPLTVLRKGNSDPFGVYPVAMNPENNALMVFTREYYLPGIQADINRPGQKAVSSEWTACISFLQDEGLAYSHFSRIAVLLKRCSQDTNSETETEIDNAVLKFKSLSMSLLQKRLKDGVQDPRTHNQILLLLNADLYEHNMPAAKAHAAAIALLLQNGLIKEDLVFVFKALYHDVQRAAMSLTRPSFDLEHWIPSQFAPLGHMIEQRLPPGTDQRVFPSALDPMVAIDAFLAEAISTLRRACVITYIAFADKSFYDMQMIFYGRFACTLSMGKLINGYLDAQTLLKSWNSEGMWDESLSMYACLRAVACLSVLLWLRRQARIDAVRITDEVSLFSANDLILQRLKETLIESQERSSPAVLRNCANTRLWALYAGAQYEQEQAAKAMKAGGLPSTRRSPTSQSPPGLSPTSGSSTSLSPTSLSSPGSSNFEPQNASHSWFNVELAAHSHGMNLHQWVEVKSILSGFVFSELVETNEAMWFANTMKAYQMACTT